MPAIRRVKSSWQAISVQLFFISISQSQRKSPVKCVPTPRSSFRGGPAFTPFGSKSNKRNLTSIKGQHIQLQTNLSRLLEWPNYVAYNVINPVQPHTQVLFRIQRLVSEQLHLLPLMAKKSLRPIVIVLNYSLMQFLQECNKSLFVNTVSMKASLVVIVHGSLVWQRMSRKIRQFNLLSHHECSVKTKQWSSKLFCMIDHYKSIWFMQTSTACMAQTYRLSLSC